MTTDVSKGGDPICLISRYPKPKITKTGTVFIENELEFSEDEPVPTDLVKCWQIVRKDEAGEEQLIGASCWRSVRMNSSWMG